MNETAMGQVAYEAYAKHTDWKSLVSGQQLPSWDALDSKIREAWAVAASAVMNAHAATVLT